MAIDFKRLEDEVAELDTVVQGVVTLLNSIAQDIRDNAGNQAKVEELANKLDSSANALAAAAAANTPAESENPIA